MSCYYPKGCYQGEITQQAMTKASTGTPQFVLRFKVLGLVLPSGETEPVNQYERTCYRAITDNTMQYLERELEALGFTGSSLRELDPNNGTYEDFAGKVVTFICAHEKDQKGEDREKWSVAWRSRESAPIEGTALQSADYRQLDALFGKAKGGSQPAKPARQQTSAPPAQPQKITNDDIPF